jgi:hypothetical protein
MLAGLVLCFGFATLVWLVFFKFKWIRFSIAWGVVSALVGLHLLIIFMIGLRFMTPLSTEAKIIQHTIQLTPRLPQPTLLTAVLVEPNVPVKKGQPLFQRPSSPRPGRTCGSCRPTCRWRRRRWCGPRPS